MKYYCDEHDSYTCDDAKREQAFDQYIVELANRGIKLQLEPDALAPEWFTV